MDNLLIIAGIIIGIGLISVLFGSFLTFDQLIRLEYNSYRSQWENDGTPRGILWLPHEYWKSQSMSWFDKWKSQYKSEWAFQKIWLYWLFSTPEWMENDEKALNLVRRYRVLVLIWNGSIILVFISIMIFGTAR